VYLKRRGDDVVVTKMPTRLGPFGNRRRASIAARALAVDDLERLVDGGPLPRLRERLIHLSESLRYEEAARLRDRIEALEHVVDRLRRLEELRTMEASLIAPAAEPGWRKAFFVCAGGVRAVRPLPPGAGARLEVEAGLALCRAATEPETLTAAQAEDLVLVHGFVRRPPPELTVLPLDTEAIVGHLRGGWLREAA
jgi:hypothetical protein